MPAEPPGDSFARSAGPRPVAPGTGVPIAEEVEAGLFSNADEVTKYIKDNDVKFVDVRFCDLPGVMQHFNVPAKSVGADFFVEGQMFDGSSITGFQAINESAKKLVPDVTTPSLDPFGTKKTLTINMGIVDPYPDEPYSRDPRQVAAKAEAY